MEGLRQYRRARDIATRRRLGVDPRGPHVMASQVRDQFFMSELATLPVDTSGKNCQILDTTDSRFGQFFNSPVLDPPGVGVPG